MKLDRAVTTGVKQSNFITLCSPGIFIGGCRADTSITMESHLEESIMQNSNTDLKLIFHKPNGRQFEVRRATLEGETTLGTIR